MKRNTWLLSAALVALIACGGGYSTAPSGGGDGGDGGDGGGGGGSGGPAGPVTVGNVFFRSVRNGTQNPAVDTIAAGQSITWTWNVAGSHSIQSTGVPPLVFLNSVVMSANASSYKVTFNKAGTYPYQCGVHGAAMTGVVVVQ